MLIKSGKSDILDLVDLKTRLLSRMRDFNSYLNDISQYFGQILLEGIFFEKLLIKRLGGIVMLNPDLELSFSFPAKDLPKVGISENIPNIKKITSFRTGHLKIV